MTSEPIFVPRSAEPGLAAALLTGLWHLVWIGLAVAGVALFAIAILTGLIALGIIR